MKSMNKVFKALMATLMVCASITINPVKAATQTLTGDYEEAINQINVPKYDENGELEKGVSVSDAIKDRLNNDNLTAQEDDVNKTLKVDFDIQGAYIASNYMNGAPVKAGTSYYNMLNFYTNVLQVRQLLDGKSEYKVIDKNGDQLTVSQIDELLDLLERINKFDPTTNLVYDDSRSTGTDVKATTDDGSVEFTFHIDSHGYWGYELGPKDSITGVVMGLVDDEMSQEGKATQREHNTKYANFFVIKMLENDKGTLYQLNGTDLENPMIYVSKDKKEALMIDVDFYGTHVLNDIIKSVIGDDCESLKIFITHNHPDHVNNLPVIAKDKYLQNITEIIWPENESVVESTKLFKKVTYIKDMETFEVAGTHFQFIEIPDEHTPGGGQLADLDNKIIHIGDTLGAQIHLGGTNISMSSAKAWLDGAKKCEKFVKDNGIKHFIGGHTPYLNTPDFASWMRVAVEYAMEQYEKDSAWAGGLTIVENGKVVSQERFKEMMSKGLSDAEELNVLSVNFANDLAKADYDKAVNEIIIPKYDENGNKVDQRVSEVLKSKLDTQDLEAIKNSRAKTLTVDFQIKDAYLASNYLNGKDPAGRSYYNMLNFYTNIKQVKQLLDANNGYVVVDSLGNKLDKSYIEELLGLLDQINDFDTKINLVYDKNSKNGTDVIATSQEGHVSFKFHIDSHGYWGYDLGAHDSITGIVMGYDEKEAFEKQHELTMKYGQFFVIKMFENDKGTLYQLNGTDLENPMIYVSKDKKEALMVDVDFYGAHVLNKVIKDIIGDDCESLKIFLTHNHGDHVNNLAVIYQDEYLRDITTLIWPENEPHSILRDKDAVTKDLVGKDLVTLFGEPIYVKDMETFEVAGTHFQFIEIPDEHTPGGGQLADLDNKIIHIGDTLGAQIHLGGTNISMSSAKAWLEGAKKCEEFVKDNGIKHFIGGHTPYLNTPDFASWMKVAVEYAMKQYEKDSTWAGGLTIVENGKVVSQERLKEMMSRGLSDAEELNVLSVNFRNDMKPEEDIDINEPSVVPPTDDMNTSNQPTTPTKTGDYSMINMWMTLTLMSICGLGVLKSKQKFDRK